MNVRFQAAIAVVVLVAAVGAGGASAHSSSTASSSVQKLSIYSVATNEQFMNHEDDRARGIGNNPFGNFKDSKTATKEAGTGPFAGDRAIFTFALYSDSNLTKPDGTATFICQYSFNKNAICDVAYTLGDGDLLGTGQFNFNAPTFAVAITGGTGKYRSRTGDVEASPAPKHSQHLAFVLS